MVLLIAMVLNWLPLFRISGRVGGDQISAAVMGAVLGIELCSVKLVGFASLCQNGTTTGCPVREAEENFVVKRYVWDAV